MLSYSCHRQTDTHTHTRTHTHTDAVFYCTDVTVLSTIKGGENRLESNEENTNILGVKSQKKEKFKDLLVTTTFELK